MTGRRVPVGAGQLAIPVPQSLLRTPARPARAAARRPAVRPSREPSQPRTDRLQLEVERVRSARGVGYRLTSPRMVGWAAVAYTAPELAAGVRQAWTEADVAAYAAWRGTTYDTPDAQDAVRGVVPRTPPPRAPLSPADAPRRRESVLPNAAPNGTERWLLRPDVADPADWTILPNGRLLAPAVPGKRRASYSPESVMGRRVLARRAAAGLPVAA